MAITIGTSGSNFSDGTPSIATVTTLATTSKLIAFAGNHQGTISNLTLNGSAMTLMATAATAFNETAEIWYIDSPGALSNVTLTGTFSGGSGRFIAYLCLEGAKSGAEDIDATATGSSSNPTVTITPTTKDSIIIACSYAEDNFITTGGEDLIFTVEGDAFECGAGSYIMLARPVARIMDFNIGSGQRWAIVAVAISPVPSVDLTSQRFYTMQGFQ